MTKDQKTFTTFEAAKICGVFHTTVINWANTGKLKVHTTPGGHRRIDLEDLLQFMQKFDMPIPGNLLSRSKKILVVEDEPSVQRMLVRTLQSMGEFTLQSCSNGLEALMAIGKDAPDLLVLDIRIPQVNGIEVCRLLRSNEQPKPIKIIAVSGVALNPDERRAIKECADIFLMKPRPTAELKSKVAELLDLEGAKTA